MYLSYRLSDANLWEVNDARMRALEFARAVDQGQIPASEKKREMTVATAFEQYYLYRLKARARTSDEMLKEFNRHWVGIKELPLYKVTPTVARDWLNSISDNGKKTGVYNKQRNMLKACFNWCIKNDVCMSSIANPMRCVEAMPTDSSMDYLTAEEVTKFFAALEPETKDVSDIFKMLFYTMARKANVLQMEWREIDVERAIWSVPPSKAKTRKPYVIALVPAALEILQQRANNGSNYVFPTKAESSKCAHIQNIQAACKRIKMRCGVAHLHVHALRHTTPA